MTAFEKRHATSLTEALLSPSERQGRSVWPVGSRAWRQELWLLCQLYGLFCLFGLESSSKQE